MGFYPLKHEVSLFVHGKRAEVRRLPWVRPAPSPKSSSACSYRWPALPPATSAAQDAGTASPRSQLLKAIVSITCSSLLLSRCLRACSSFSSAAKIWRSRDRRESEDVSLYSKQLLVAHSHAGSLTASGHEDVAPWEAVHVPSCP